MDETWDVVVVGAGPTGLLTAAELALGGVSVCVLERENESDPTIKAGSINVATAEVLDRRGLLPAARRAQQRMIQEVVAFRPDLAGALEPAGFPVAGHFAGMFFRRELVDQDHPELRAHRAAANAVLVPQRQMEAILTEYAVGLGVDIRRGVEVTGLQADQETVTLQTSGGRVQAGWAVGADGGRSRVRTLAGIDFPGTDPEITGYQGIADLDGAEKLRPGWTWTPTGVYSYGPIPGRILTVQFTGAPADRSAPVSAEELQASIRLVTGIDVTVTGLRGTTTRWTDNARQADSYRHGRVLLAGDAAHVHSPFSGQGLNLGIGDASNLGWKLAATIKGWAPDGLLDTYHAERHPIGAWVLDWTRAQVALMRGDAKTGQLRTAVEQQLFGTREAMTRLVALTSGIAQRYTLDGSAVASEVEFGGVDFGEGERPGRVGRLLNDIPLADGSRLADHAHNGRFVLLDRTPDHRLETLAERWRDRVVVVVDAPRPSEPVGVLVRPDGVIIWAAIAGPDGDLDENRVPEDWAAALTRWVGRPRSSA